MATAPDPGFRSRQTKIARHYSLGRSAAPRMTGDGDRAVESDGRLLAHEAHDLVRKDPYVESALNSWEANCVGPGIRPYPLWENADLEHEVRDLWARSQEELDADGVQSFYAMQSLAARSVVESGELFIRKRIRRVSDGLTVPIQFQMLEAEMLPLNLTKTADNGNKIQMGIEKDLINRRVAYHFYRSHPGSSGASITQETAIVPADQVFHIGKPKRPGQTRFASHLAPAVESLKIMHDAGVAMAERIRTSAMFTGYVSTKTDELDAEPFEAVIAGEEEQPALLGEGDPDESGHAITQEIEPGTIIYLDDNQTIYFPDPPDVGTNFGPFMQSYIRAFASSLGLTYEAVAGDLNKTNFSSARVGAMEMRRRVEQFVGFCLIDQFCKRVWRAWITEAVLSGAIDLPGFTTNPWPYYNVMWRHPGWEWVNPVDEAQAAVIEIRGGLNSRSNLALKRGREPEAVDNENHSDQVRAQQLSLFYDSDPKHELITKGLIPGESSREQPETEEDDEE